MKKLFLMLLFMLILTGCTNINKLDTDSLIDTSLSKDDIKTNMGFKGYKLYVPFYMNIISNRADNNIFYTDREKYYLYVDIISYYTKASNSYKINEESNLFYSKTLTYDGKEGYVLVTKYKSKYFVEVMYNYAKIEVISKSYKNAICNSLLILKNINYNDKILDSLIGSNTLEYDEEKYNLLGPTNNNTDFLEWNYEDVDNELKDLDESIINVEESE